MLKDYSKKHSASERAREILRYMNCTPKVGHKTTFGGAVFL